MVNHGRLYNALLVALAAGILCSVGVLVAFMALPADARPAMKVPPWSVPLLAFVNGAYLCAVVLTLIFRLTKSAASRHLTRGVNVALLLTPPFGTALGLYGLWAVGRPV